MHDDLKGDVGVAGNTYIFLLFVTGMSIRSVKAIENIKSLCEQYLKGRYTLEVVDVFKSPEEVEQYNIIACPTLLRIAPLPTKRLVGDLSDTGKVLTTLRIK